MDSSKALPGTEECSSSESGWTTYIASPDKEYDHVDDEDDEVGSGSIGQQSFKKDGEEDAESDDSMASDASSGPSDQGNLFGKNHGFGHAGRRDERKYVGKKHEEKKKKHHEQIKGETDKSGNKANSAGRFKKF